MRKTLKFSFSLLFLTVPSFSVAEDSCKPIIDEIFNGSFRNVGKEEITNQIIFAEPSTPTDKAITFNVIGLEGKDLRAYGFQFVMDKKTGLVSEVKPRVELPNQVSSKTPSQASPEVKNKFEALIKLRIKEKNERIARLQKGIEDANNFVTDTATRSGERDIGLSKRAETQTKADNASIATLRDQIKTLNDYLKANVIDDKGLVDNKNPAPDRFNHAVKTVHRRMETNGCLPKVPDKVPVVSTPKTPTTAPPASGASDAKR